MSEKSVQMPMTDAKTKLLCPRGERYIPYGYRN
jgi:hypothetical protein